jgi:hypothetical protein
MKRILVFLAVMTFLMGSVVAAAPVFSNVAFESSDDGSTWTDMPGDLANGFVLSTNRNPSTDYLIKYDGTTVTDLDTGPFGLFLISSSVSKDTLKDYYDNRVGLPEAYKAYLKDAVDGVEPFVYIMGPTGSLFLQDAAQWDVYSNNPSSMRIPGDYPIGVYTVQGVVNDGGSGETTVTYKLIVSGDHQGVSGYLDNVISISVSPASLDFGSIPKGTDITDSGSDVTIDTSGSDTASDEVIVYANVVGDDAPFYQTLLEFEIASSWVDVLSAVFTISEGESEVYSTQLHGDTTVQSAGLKEATIVYTAYGESLEP